DEKIARKGVPSSSTLLYDYSNEHPIVVAWHLYQVKVTGFIFWFSFWPKLKVSPTKKMLA
uniref:Uncharacterized protein n=1 Tax=Ciona intestinalis TaxID=7719 RepID=H2XUC4_CIOIN